MIKKRKKTSFKKDGKVQSLGLLFLLLVLGYNNCSDVSVIGNLRTASLSVSGVDPRADTVDYTGAVEKSQDRTICIPDSEGGMYAMGVLNYMKGPYVPKYGVHDAAAYPLLIAVGSDSCIGDPTPPPAPGEMGSLDPIPTGPPKWVEIRHNAVVNTVVAFRVKTQADVTTNRFEYIVQNTGMPLSKTKYSISKIPGDIASARENSTEYCNLRGDEYFVVSDRAISQSAYCRVLQNSYYYINVLDPRLEPYPSPTVMNWLMFILQPQVGLPFRTTFID